MSGRPGPIVYMSGTLPALSETFVSSEVLGLRRMGFDVRTVSVHPPQTGLGSDDLDEMARETVTLYEGGAVSVIARGLWAFVGSPLRSARVLLGAVRDASAGRDLPLQRRLKVVYQAVAALSFGRLLRSCGASHVHAHFAHVPCTIAMYAAQHAGITFSFTGHAVDIFKERTLLGEKLRRCAFVSCISEWHRAFYREVAPIEDDRSPVIRCGVPIPTARAEPILSGEPVALLGVGRLVPKKGFDTLLRALRLPAIASSDIRCTMIGDGDERESLVSLAEESGVSERVSFTGAMPNSAIRERMLGQDLFVLPCRTASSGDRDGIPVVLMEAMAAGACAISGDLPAIRELIEDGRTGLLVPGDDEHALAEAIGKLIENPALARRMAAAGREHVESEFSSQVNLERLASSIRQFTAAGPSGESAVSETGETRS